MEATTATNWESEPWSEGFPQSGEEYFRDKPREISYLAWLGHPANPYRFERVVYQCLRTIEYKGRITGYSFLFQETLARILGYSSRWVRTIVNRLETIGILRSKKVRKNRQMQIVPAMKALLFGKATKVVEPSVDEINEMFQTSKEQDEADRERYYADQKQFERLERAQKAQIDQAKADLVENKVDQVDRGQIDQIDQLDQAKADLIENKVDQVAQGQIDQIDQQANRSIDQANRSIDQIDQANRSIDQANRSIDKANRSIDQVKTDLIENRADQVAQGQIDQIDRAGIDQIDQIDQAKDEVGEKGAGAGGLGVAVVTPVMGANPQVNTNEIAVTSGETSGETSGDKSVVSPVNPSIQKGYGVSSTSQGTITVDKRESMYSIISGGDDGNIITRFELLTGTKYLPIRDSASLLELQTLNPLAVELGMIESAILCQTKIHSLKYMIGRCQEFHNHTLDHFIKRRGRELRTRLATISNGSMRQIIPYRWALWRKLKAAADKPKG